MHTMQSHAASHRHGGEEEEGGSVYMVKKAEENGVVGDTIAAVVGMLVPLVTQVGHARSQIH